MERGRHVVAPLLAVALMQLPPAVGAQPDCLADLEPNDMPETAQLLLSDCGEGELPDGDQDLAIWEVTPADALSRWVISVDGQAGLLTALKFFPITSEPGASTLVVGRSHVLEVQRRLQDTDPGVVQDVLFPVGRYLLGISRSAVQGMEGDAAPGYRYRIERGAPLPSGAEIEPNDRPDTATTLQGAASVSGDLDGSADFYSWHVEDTADHWAIELQVPLGETAAIELFDPGGVLIDSVRGDSSAVSLDLDLEPGDYTIAVSPRAYQPTPYSLSTSRAPAEGDPEPNDLVAGAVPIEVGEPFVGRLVGRDDHDLFRVDVLPGSEILRDLRAIWDSDIERTLCLVDDAGLDVVCKRGPRGVALTELALPPGPNIFSLRGTSDSIEPYLIRLDVTSDQRRDFESEPNEVVAYATDLDPDLDMHGRGGATDVDVFKLRTGDEPGLWEVDLQGPPGSRLEWIAPSGRVLDEGKTGDGDVIARLTDLYLVPGEHWFRVTRAAGDYDLEVKPLGPLRADAESEPNGEPILADRYRIGSQRTGRLAVSGDVDVWRFSLAAPQHIAFELTQPADASTRMTLSHGGEPVGDISGRPTGESLRYDVWLQPGDHFIELRPEQVSTGIYTLHSTRLDPFELAVDQEPNDGPAEARPVPGSLTWRGEGIDGTDEDWFRLPPLTSAAPLRLSIDDEQATIRLITDAGPQTLHREGPGVFVADALAPHDEPYVVVSTDGPYEVVVDGPGVARTAEVAAPLELDVGLEASTLEVAAYWPLPQAIEADVELINLGDEPLELVLETVTSDHLWQVAPGDETLSLGGGETRSIPLRLTVGADAWADDPVLVTVGARHADGRLASASLELVARPGATPVSPTTEWTVPEQLLGALNVAGAGLGAQPGGTVRADAEAQLFDGVTPDGAGFVAASDQLPLDLVVDLAGDQPIPVAGTIVNPQARDGRLSETPRDLELLLSTDGVEWSPALQMQLSPLPVDQAFVLDPPVEATHAMLRVTSLHGDRPGRVAIGEWKVLAAPGVVPTDAPLDIAAGAMGGHVVRFSPAAAEPTLPASLLDDDPTREFSYLEDDRTLDVTIGFHEGRAAQVAALEWVDPSASKPGERIDTAQVMISQLGPFGPWEPLAEWPLTRIQGEVPPLVLPEPVWARYVRLVGSAPEDARALELPGTIRVLERPTDEEYRSIIGEWGYTSSGGPFEWLSALDPDPVTTESSGVDAADQPATATELAQGVLVSDRVEIDVDEDWYLIEVPVDHNTLEVSVSGQPTVRTSLELYDEGGAQRPLAFMLQPDGDVHYQAAVQPGLRYHLRVRQPPFSAVFTFDTSSSMEPFRDLVIEGMRSFAADVRPGREAVSILPFEEPPLLPGWEDDAYRLEGAVAAHDFNGGSSGAEAGLIDAADLLAEREGGRAVLLVTDAETSTYRRSEELWERLERVRPIVFSVHVGAQTRPVEARHLMQDWAASGGGHYSYPTTHGEMERAFERMATWLRRPADYQLSYSTVSLAPSSLAVRAPSDSTAAGLAPGVGVEIILDTSGSMNELIDGRSRIDVAKDSLRALIGETLADGTPVAMRTFGGKGKKAKARCQTRLLQRLEPLDRRAMLELVGGMRAAKKTKTPIADALLATAKDLGSVTGPRSIVLVTDGNETCKGDPAAAIEELRAAGLDITLNIVGFALEDEALKIRMTEWAEAGDGTYFDAAGADDLVTSMAAALAAPFRVYGPDGDVYEGGTVGGAPILIDPGTYRVEVLTDPVVSFDEVVVGGGEAVSLELPS